MRIETERLLIRNIELNDFDDCFEHRSDPEVCRYIGAPLTREQTKDKIAQSMLPWSGKEGEKLMLAIELKQEKKLIGELMFKFSSLDHLVGEIGYRINTKYQGRGYALEASRSFIATIFKQLNAHKVSALCLADNEASWRLMEKLGMQREGFLKSHFKVNELWHDAYIYSILES
jgi:[ribosomal protein S5]-alanine N-acetyltransferase